MHQDVRVYIKYQLHQRGMECHVCLPSIGGEGQHMFANHADIFSEGISCHQFDQAKQALLLVAELKLTMSYRCGAYVSHNMP